MSDDDQVIEQWWQAFVATGALPEDLALVQGRLIRAVHRGRLPSGQVHIKVMTFPRAKDRLRYLLRGLPAAHEAQMLERVRQAGLPCPEVVAVRTQRRWGLPHRSMLVLRTLAQDAEPEQLLRRVEDEVDLAVRLLAAGIYHRDLHTENFLRTPGGELAVLDLQSALRIDSARAGAHSVRLGLAVRLLRDRSAGERDHALARMRELELLRDELEVTVASRRAAAEERRYLDSRVKRCLMNSTEFERRIRPSGVECRFRGEWPQGRWWRGPGELKAAWLGQRRRQLMEGQAPVFAAFFQKWWWLGGGARLYVPATCADERIEDEVREAALVSNAHASGPVVPS